MTECKSDEAKAWDEWFAKYSFGALPIAATLTHEGAHMRLDLKLSCKDIHDPTKEITVNSTSTFHLNWHNLPDALADAWLYSELQKLWMHELDEMITFQGQRIYDPHQPWCPRTGAPRAH